MKCVQGPYIIHVLLTWPVRWRQQFTFTTKSRTRRPPVDVVSGCCVTGRFGLLADWCRRHHSRSRTRILTSLSRPRPRSCRLNWEGHVKTLVSLDDSCVVEGPGGTGQGKTDPMDGVRSRKTLKWVNKLLTQVENTRLVIRCTTLSHYWFFFTEGGNVLTHRSSYTNDPDDTVSWSLKH